MGSVVSSVLVLVQFVIPRLFLLFTGVFVIPACFTMDTGLRKIYKSVLVKLIKWGSKTAQPKVKKRKKRNLSNGDDLIQKENSIKKVGSFKDLSESEEKFKLEDMTFLIKSGIEAVIDDDVTKRFVAEELTSWNLLTRTNYTSTNVNFRLSFLWFVGLMFRHLVLFPLRVFLTITCMVWMFIVMIPVSMTPDSKIKSRIIHFANIVSARVCCRAFTGIVKYHDREKYLPQPGSICVANHTTTLDVLVLQQDRTYSVLGQIHGGILGWFERVLSKCSNHIWFERSEVRHRKLVVQRIEEHLANPDNDPILLFPEGTCINNTCVMMFKKGTFEIPATISPVAIKYDPLFGDAFWNSSKHSMMQYLAVVFTSWALVANVWYLPPMKRQPGEDASHFANRVRSAIAAKAGLEDCSWDGLLKRAPPKESQKQEIKKEISKIVLKGYNFDEIILENPLTTEKEKESEVWDAKELKPKFSAGEEVIELTEQDSMKDDKEKENQQESVIMKKENGQGKRGTLHGFSRSIYNNLNSNSPIEIAPLR